MPENEDVWDLWLASQTQWRGGGMGAIGLDYLCVSMLAEMMRIEWTPALIKKLQALEHAALKRTEDTK